MLPMLFMADTDVVVEVLRASPAAVTWLATLPTLPTLPGPVIWEVISGCRNAVELQRTQAALLPYSVHWPSAIAAENAVRILASYRLAHGVGVMDAVIAACVLEAGATLYIFNVRHYRVIPGLSFSAPYARP